MNETQLYPAAIEIQVYAALLLRFFNQALEERLRQHGERISSLQHGILRMLQVETLTISEISQRLGLDPSTLVRAVDSLERKDLAQRGSDPKDRRRNPITITEKGNELVTQVPIISDQDPTFQALQALGGEATTQIRDLLCQFVQEFPEGKTVVDLMSDQMINPSLGIQHSGAR
jgi:DNA-binding MarR family transcriptional regulator